MAVWLAAVFLAVILVALFCIYFFCRRREGSRTKPHFDRAAAIKISVEVAEAVEAAELAEAMEASKALIAAEAVRAAAKQHREFTYAELDKATESFTTKLGNGKFGDVYKGRLEEEEEEDKKKWVAVKEMKNFADAKAQKEFITEVNNAGKLMHRNLVQLIGYCFEPRDRKLLIVFDFVNNGTLDHHLFSSPAVLSWGNRYKIAVGLAAGIEYLHFGCKQSMIHRDIKPANVMLDADFNPQLGDFGLSRFTKHNQSMQSTAPAGTVPYLPPEFFDDVKATLASDVYAFGMVLLQTVTGRKEFHVQEQKVNMLLVSWVWMLNHEGRLLEAVDPRLVAGNSHNYSRQEAKRLLRVGLRCCEWTQTGRPTMKDVKLMLEGKSPIQVKPLEGKYKDSLVSWESQTSPSQGKNDNFDHASSSTTRTYYTAASTVQHKTSIAGATKLPPKLPPGRTSESSPGNRTTGPQPVNGHKNTGGQSQPPKPPPKALAPHTPTLASLGRKRVFLYIKRSYYHWCA